MDHPQTPADPVPQETARLQAAEPDDRPDSCPECGTTVFDFAPNYSDGCSSAPAWLCTGCKWGTRAYPDGALQ